jgi:hypothetical protein
MARSQRLMGGWRAAPYYTRTGIRGRTLTSILGRALTRSEISALGARSSSFFYLSYDFHNLRPDLIICTIYFFFTCLLAKQLYDINTTQH